MLDWFYKKGAIRLDIDGDISSDTLKGFVKLYREISGSKTARTINIAINSKGGDSLVGRACYRILKDLGKKHKINTLALRECSSSAISIFLAGQKRYSLEESTFGVHQGYFMYSSEDHMHVSELYDDYKRLKIYEKVEWDMYEREGVKMPKKIMDKIMVSRDTVYIHGTEAHKYGFVTNVL